MNGGALLNGAWLPRRLAPKLILSLTALVILVQGIAALGTLRIHRRQLLDQMILGADQLSSTITNGTWHAMLADRREDAYQMMQNIGRQPGIEKIRIFNKDGRIMFSTVPEAGTMVDKNAEECYFCHARSKPLVRVDVPSRVRYFRRAGGGRVMGMVSPIYNEPSCSEAACHAHPSEIQVLGVLDVSMSLDRVDREMAGAGLGALGVTLLTIAVSGAFIVFFTRRFVGQPIRKLIDATQAVSAMELDHPVAIDSADELGELAGSFERMRQRLKSALEEINLFTESLERKVEERTEELRTAQQNLIRRDRLASLGQLSAVMAHEINNPVSGVHNFAMLMDRIMTPEGIPPGRVEEFRRYLCQIERETDRIGRIVTDLLTFARQSRPKRVWTDLNLTVRDSLALLAHKLEQSHVRTETDLALDLPLLWCDKTQVMQVVINLVLNASESMTRGGTVRIRTSRHGDPDGACLEIRDCGAGIAAGHLPHIFEPFFTTKEDGKGVGLGLAVVYGIVNAHGGSIEIQSRPGQGTSATVILPAGSPDGDER